ncbi:MAG TPA: GAF domain-containing protein, partial [Chloroflexi bacterium]|nr:GAF domain-containing protein [Chloroflexota bacterium]
PHAYGEEEQLLLSTIADQVAVAVENARLFEETRRRLTREVRLNELAHTLGGEMGLATLIPRLLPVVAELTGADAATVAILDPEEQVIVYPYHYNLPASLAAIQVPAESGLAGYTIRARQPVLLDDYKEHPAALQPWVEAGVRSLLAVPLVAGDEVVGMIGLCSLGEVRPFRPEAVAAAQAAARLAAVAVQRVRLFEAEREQRELAEALGEATAVVGSTLDLDQVLDRILEQVERVVAGDAFNIMLVEDDTARMVGWRGYEELGVEDRLATLSFPIAEYRNLMRMAQTGEPFVMLDAAADPDWVTLEGWEWLQSCIAAPIQVGGVTVGFLNVDGTRPGQFSLGDVRRLQTFASHAATAIENARLYQEVQGYTRELEQRVAERTSDLERRTIQLRAAAAVASDAVTAQELDDLLDRVVNLVRDRFGFYHVGIFLVDEEGEYAILKAATGEAGRQMLEYGHKLKVGEVGIVGHVTGSGQPHVALDVGADAAHFKNPLLPETRSELALPLRVGEQTIGALDVQSTQEAAFDEEDVTILQTMTDQLAVAIEKLKRTAQIQAQYARLEAILRSTTDGIIVANREGKILHTNPVTQRWLTQTLSPEEAERLWKTVQGLALQAEERPQTVLELTGLDLELSAAPVVGEGAEEPTVVVAAHDVSHLKALERMKSRFVTSVSHELRTPVTTIKLYAELMQRRPEKWREYLQPLLQEADHQARLVEDILQISRIDAGRLGLKPCPTLLNELTEMTIINHQALAQERRLTLEHQPAEPGPAVLVDPEWVMQALNNLVTNALYYTPEGGRVVVSTGREEAEGRAWATATVADTGMGIPEEELPHIFERFFRGVKPRQMQISGTGLGLAIVKEIVELHGGWVTVESQVGEGTTFTVWLPLAL